MSEYYLCPSSRDQPIIGISRYTDTNTCYRYVSNILGIGMDPGISVIGIGMLKILYIGNGIGIISRYSSNLFTKEGNFPVACDYQLTQKASIIKHQQSVHEGRKFLCGSCDYQASSRGNLSTHQQSVHEGRRFPCGSCDYQATQKTHLTAHQQSVHGGRTYICDQCSFQFRHKTSLTKHQQLVHEGK